MFLSYEELYLSKIFSLNSFNNILSTYSKQVINKEKIYL